MQSFFTRILGKFGEGRLGRSGQLVTIEDTFRRGLVNIGRACGHFGLTGPKSRHPCAWQGGYSGTQLTLDPADAGGGPTPSEGAAVVQPLAQ